MHCGLGSNGLFEGLALFLDELIFNIHSIRHHFATFPKLEGYKFGVFFKIKKPQILLFLLNFCCIL